MIFDFTELEIKHAASDLCKTFNAFSRSSSLVRTTTGLKTTSLIIYLPSTISSFPIPLDSKFLKFNLKFSAIARKVVIRQLLIAATNKCSGDQMPGIPFGNSGGVATSIEVFKTSECIVPFRSEFQVNETSYKCCCNIASVFTKDHSFVYTRG